jgi:hypothetical protein
MENILIKFAAGVIAITLLSGLKWLWLKMFPSKSEEE